MLVELYVKNLALIEEIRLSFHQGFSVVSGETGAGKSLFVESLNLLLGARASTNLVRRGQEEAVIEAVFDIQKLPHLRDLIQDMGLVQEDDLILRRLISAKGKSRAFVNGQALSLSQLSQISFELVDFSGQHDQQVLLNEEKHLFLFDSFLQSYFKETHSLFQSYSESYEPFRRKLNLYNDKKRAGADIEKRIDFLSFQKEEIEKASINDPLEEEDLLNEKKRVKNLDFLSEFSSYAVSRLSESDDSLLSQLQTLDQKLQKASLMDESLQEMSQQLTELLSPFQDLAASIEDYQNTLEAEPGRLDQIESRLFELQQIKRKYGQTLQEVIDNYQKITEELEQLQNNDQSFEDLEKELNLEAEELFKKAKQLSQMRIKRAKDMERFLQKELQDLAMPKVVFKLKIQTKTKANWEDFKAEGLDELHFSFSANPGEPPKALAEIASGGELSRILLAFKKILASSQTAKVYLFDEIDTGIGGAVAEVVGRKMKEISKHHQVLAVTHLAQIAAYADHHYRIEKSSDDSSTQTHVDYLKKKDQRIEELSRMIGGLELSEKVRAHAREILKKSS